MAFITGPQLDKIVDQARDWYESRIVFLIERLEEGYPFGSVRLTPLEQLNRYRSMTPNDWAAFVARLEARYSGLRDKRERVQHDIDAFVTRMKRLEAELAGRAEE